MNHAFNTFLAAGLIGLLSSTSAQATAVSGQGTLGTTLQARDLNGDQIADAYYDTSTNLTWLADANLIKTSQFTLPNYPFLNPQADGQASWFLVEMWQRQLRIDGTTGWRLPTVIDATSCSAVWIHTVCNRGIQAGSSELENLLKATLGNSNGLTNTGPFQNLQAGEYWTNTQVRGYLSGNFPYWAYNTSSGSHSELQQNLEVTAFAWVLHDGDIGIALAVPEPSTYALLMCGLAALGARSRRSANQGG